MHKQEIKELFQKYLSGNIASGEIKRLKKLVAGMDETSFDAHIRQLWDGYMPEGRNLTAYNDILNNLKAILRPEKRRTIGYYWWRAAAAVFLPLLFVATVYLHHEGRKMKSIKNQEYIVHTDKGERARITLPDGTKVYLNSQTSLAHPVSFALDKRVVKLTGEAYFEVSCDRKKPFIVQTPELEIKVLGTTFNIYAYPDDCWFVATLVEGKIEATPTGNPENAIVLNAGQKVRYNSVSAEINVSEADLRLDTAWRTEELIFRSESIPNVLKKLETFYGVEIIIEGAIPNELFTGSFREDDVNIVLTNLQNFYLFSFNQTDNILFIKFNNQPTIINN